MGKKHRKRRRQGAATSNTPAKRFRWSPDLRWALGLSLLAWLHRLAFLHSNRDRSWPFTFFYEGDSRTFFEYARALLDGRLYDSGIPFHPPGFPLFLAGLHTLLGAGSGATEIPHLAVKSVLALVSSLSVGLLYLLVRPYLGRTAALVAALVCVYHFGLYVIAVAPVSEGLYLTLLLAALLIWSRKFEHPLSAPEARSGGPQPGDKPWLVGLGLGLLLGVLALLRAESVLITALLTATGLLGVFLRGRRSRANNADPPFSIQSALRPWLLIGVGFVLALTPWTWRNATRLAEFNKGHAGQLAEPLPTFVPLTIYGPINLALANRAGADGTFSPDPLKVGNASGGLDFTLPEHLRFVLHGDEMAWQWIRSHPVDWIVLVLEKWALQTDAFKLGWTQWNFPGGLNGIRRPVDMFVPDSSPTKWVLPVLMLVGWIACVVTPGGPRRWALISGLLIGAGFFTTALFFGYVRQAVLLLPIGFSLMVAGPCLILNWIRTFSPWYGSLDLKVPKRLKAGLLILAVLLLALEGWGARSNRNFEATGDTGADGHHLNSDSTIHLKVLD